MRIVHDKSTMSHDYHQVSGLLDKLISENVISSTTDEVKGLLRTQMLRLILENTRYSECNIEVARFHLLSRLEGFTLERIRAKCFVSLILRKLDSFGLLNLELQELIISRLRQTVEQTIGADSHFDFTDFNLLTEGYFPKKHLR
jgi:hypothetical protein